MSISASRERTMRHRLNPLQGAVLALCLLAAQAQAVPVVYGARVLATHYLNGDETTVVDERSGLETVSASATGGTAAALSGSLTATAQGSGSFTAGPPDNNTRDLRLGADSRATLSWSNLALDPPQAGKMATLTFSITGNVQAQATRAAFGSGASFAEISSAGGDLSTSGRVAFCPECGSGIIRPFNPLSGSLAINAGSELTLTVQASGSGGAAGQITPTSPAGNGSGSADVTLVYDLQVFEDRRHWEPAAAADMAASESWIERASPDGQSWATFNDTSARTLALVLPGDREWRGLIVDGENLNLNLNARTLTLGTAGPSQKTYSIRLGEGRSTEAVLTLRNGTVLAANDVVIGGVFGSTGPGATLTLDGAAVLDQSQGIGLGSVLVGDLGPGSLVVRGGSQLMTNVLALARKAPGADDTGPLKSTLEISGIGTQVNATLVSLGDRGEASATVSNGAVLRTQSIDLAQNIDAKATLTITDTGSKLILTGGFADIGANGGRGTLQALAGGAIEGNSSIIRVGSGKPADFSVLRVSGVGSRLDDAGVVVNAGGSFELRESAQWTGVANVLEVKGGQATINKAQAKVTNVSVEGLFSGKSLVSSGVLTIDNGATLDATGANLTVGEGGRLTVTGTGSRLFGFSTMEVNGLLTVNFGSTLEGDTLALRADSALQGTGTIKVNNKFTAAGQIKPGNSPGLLRIEGNLELTDSAEVVLEMGGTAAGTEYDVLQVTGNLTLLGGHVNLAFINGFAPRQGQQFVLLDVGGSFQSAAAFGVTGLESGWQFDTTFDPGTGKLTLNSLSDGVSAVPEPATWCLWAAAGLAAWLKRRRAA